MILISHVRQIPQKLSLMKFYSISVRCFYTCFCCFPVSVQQTSGEGTDACSWLVRNPAMQLQTVRWPSVQPQFPVSQSHAAVRVSPTGLCIVIYFAHFLNNKPGLTVIRDVTSELLFCCFQVCPAGDSCENQCFSKRLYAETEVVKTDDRGWGLKTNQVLRKVSVELNVQS